MDQNLLGLATSLEQTLFDCIPPLIKILLRDPSASWYKRAGKAIKATLGDELAEVDGILQQLTTAQRCLQQAFSGLVEERDDHTSRIVSATHESLKELRSFVEGTSTVDNKVEILLDRTERSTNTLDNKMDILLSRTERRELAVKDSVLEYSILNLVHNMTAEFLRKRHIYAGE